MRRTAPAGSLVGVLPTFWPELGFLACAAKTKTLVLLDDVPFRSEDGIHRARVRDHGVEVLLTVPLRASAARAPLGAIEIRDPSGWAGRMMRALEHAYQDAPFLEHHRCDLARLLFHDWRQLVALDLAMLRFLLRAFELPHEVLRASELPAGSTVPARTLPQHGPVWDRSALDALLWLGPAARGLLRPTHPIAPHSRAPRRPARAAPRPQRGVARV